MKYYSYMLHFHMPILCLTYFCSSPMKKTLKKHQRNGALEQIQKYGHAERMITAAVFSGG